LKLNKFKILSNSYWDTGNLQHEITDNQFVKAEAWKSMGVIRLSKVGT